MIVNEDREVKSERFLREATTFSEVETSSDDSHYEGDLLVVRWLIYSHTGEEVSHFGELMSIILNRGSFVNVAGKRLVKKLDLPTIVHLRPYRLQWLSEKEELLVDKEVEVTFNLGGYEDKVVYNVVSMKATHLLLGRPCQFDKKVIHDGVTNQHFYTHREKGCA
ncbi:hypothetical protein CR513_36194, partial [Mucuna pruriens]